MKGRVFTVGFGASIVLLALCAGYAFSPRWDDNFVLFFAKDGGYTGSPAGFRYTYLLFLILNLPALPISVSALYLLDLAYVVTGKARVVLVFVLLFLSSLAWWWTAARCSGWWSGRSRRSANPSSS
jgi:hypothetical protein